MQAQNFRRAAGVAVPLFSLRDSHDVGSGEILDLVPFINWLARWHQGVVQLLPINEAAAAEGSPYNTLSVFAIDPGYVSASRAVDVLRSADAQAWLQSRAVRTRMRRCRAGTRARRSAYGFQLHLLEFGFTEFARRAAHERTAAFERFCRLNAWWLDDYALFRALKERQRWTSWETWPDALRDREPDTLQRAATALQPRMRFFRYVQWIAAEQWRQVRAHARDRGVVLKGDLPFVCGRDSADVWAHPELFDLGSSAGAPPDAFSPSGQAWGLPLYNWGTLRKTGYDWWRRRARQARELYDVFRIDHVVGLYRTYAIPIRVGGTSGFVPVDEHEQLAQGHDLLAAVLEEAAGAGVIAEDLGTVPQWVRASLTQLGIPGYKVFRWEKEGDRYIDPRSFPRLSVATTGTHDTDTLVTWWQTLDDRERTSILSFLDVDEAGHTDSSRVAWTAHLHLAVLRRLYEASSVLTILPIQDLFGWPQRINTPATVDAGNWTYRLPAAIGDLDRFPGIAERMAAIRAMIDQNGRSTDVVD